MTGRKEATLINVGTAMGYLDLDTSKFEKGLSSALSSLKDFSKGSELSATSLVSLGNGISSVGTTLTHTFTLPLVAAGTAATGFASNFETSLSKVKAISGATAGEMVLLKDKALDMGAQTKFSASEAADAMQYMAMAGWKTESMLEGISGIMDLAAADGLDLATASDIVTDALTAFGLQAKDSAKFADVLAKASSTANTNVSMLGESFKYVAPVAGALGYSVEDISIALGLMANSGIKASQAGTTLRASLSRMVKPTDKAAAAMEKYGISLSNQDGTMKTYKEVMDSLRAGLGDLSEAEQAKTATILFGQEAMSGMLAIINASEEDYNKLTDAIYNSEGAAQEMASTMMDNLSGSFEEMMGALETLAIKVGDLLSPVIRDIIDSIGAFIDKLSEMSEEELKQMIQIAALVAAIGPFITIFGKLISSIGMLSLGFKAIGELSTSLGASFTTMLGPILAVIAVVGLLIAAFVDLWKNNEDFRNNVIAIWEEIKSSFEGFINEIVERLNEMGITFESVTNFLKALWEGFTSILAPLFKGAFKLISDTVSLGLNLILSLFDYFRGVLTGDWELMLAGLVNALKSFFNFGVDIFENFLTIVGEVCDTIGKWFGDTFGGIFDAIDAIGKGISDVIKGTSIMSEGSHANGLNYVPYDGYRATLHKGEKVLTVNEAEEYDNKNSGRSTNIFNFTSPKAIDAAEAERRIREVIRRIDEGFEV